MLNRFQRSLPTPRLSFATRHTKTRNGGVNGMLWHEESARGKWHLQLSRAATSVAPFRQSKVDRG